MGSRMPPHSVGMRFTPLPTTVSKRPPKTGAPHYARAGGELRWTRIPTPAAPGPGLEVRWYKGTLFAKLTAEAIPPLAPFVPSAPGGHGQSWTRRCKAVHKAGYYCEAYPRSDKHCAVVCWKARCPDPPPSFSHHTSFLSRRSNGCWSSAIVRHWTARVHTETRACHSGSSLLRSCTGGRSGLTRCGPVRAAIV